MNIFHLESSSCCLFSINWAADPHHWVLFGQFGADDKWTGCSVTWNLSSVSLSPIWRRRSPLAWPMLPAAVSTVCLGCTHGHARAHTHTQRDKHQDVKLHLDAQLEPVTFCVLRYDFYLTCTVFRWMQHPKQHQCHLTDLFKSKII